MLRIKSLIISVLVILVFICGCGKENRPEVSNTPALVNDDWEPIKVLDHTWKGYSEVKEDTEPWHTESFIDGFGALPAGENNFFQPVHVWLGEVLYSLAYCYEQQGDNNIFFFRLSEINTASMEEKSTRFDLSDIILPEDGDVSIDDNEWKELCETVRKGGVQLASVDVLGDRFCFFFVRYDMSEDASWSISNYYALETDKDLNLKNLADYAEPLLGDKRSDIYMFPQGVLTKDEELCFIDDSARQMSVFSWEGTKKDSLDLAGVIGDLPTILVGRADDKTPIFQSSFSSNKVSYFTPKGLIFQGDDYIPISCLDDEGGMLLWKDDALVRWNVESGETAKLCNLSGLSWNNCKGFRKNSSGKIVLAYDDEEDGLCCFSYSPGAAKERVLRIAQFSDNSGLERCAADYERTHPGVRIEFTSFDNPYQNSMALNLLAIDCKEENAPDLILFTEKGQLDNFKESGCLAPVDGMISAETKKGLFDCILDLGKSGDGYYGISYQVILECFLVSKSDWNKDSWTIREIMDCFRKAKAKEPDLERFMALNFAADSQQLLYNICLINMDDTPFVNFENGSCNFDCQEFKDLLEFCMEFADSSSTDTIINNEDRIASVRSGKAFSLLSSGGITDYSKSRASLGKEYTSVGIPSESGSGYIAEGYCLLSVNAFSENMDLAADFLEYLLSERCQVKFASGRWVRKDVIQSHIVEHYVNWRGETECVFMRGNSIEVLDVDENGDSFVQEFIEIMDKAQPYSAHQDVRDIIFEEADAYFKGAKTVDEVAKIIQSRVYIYLQEKQ
ncbi:MAG: extracellular solute-binding protein [Lachnospiraceae bacterium]|nr:extracellular solute-binding protein [Lachnospiraceae bacterium]